MSKEKIMENRNLLKSTYFYNLPEEQIAQVPVEPRDSSRLLVFNRKNSTHEDKIFRDILAYLKKGDCLVINDTRVLPARLFGVKESTGARIEILLQKRLNLKTWSVISRPQKRLKIGTKIVFFENFSAKVTKIGEFGECEVEFDFSGSFEENLLKVGTMPLPPYIKEKLKDSERYQTVYSKVEGSSAAPTAGLHFTKELLEKIEAKGVKIARVLLHVGLGTFRPVSEDNILNHKMHSEHIEITKDTADIINATKRSGGRIIDVGTTSVRTIESSVSDNGEVLPCVKDTSIFIYPPYKFKVVDALITNFHLPESTLLMLVSAFIGDIDKTLELYNYAVKSKYRFFSFGDAMFLY